MTLPTTLAEWLAHCERLHPKNIDMTLARTQLMIERLQLKFACPVISVAGTNGKGSTCAMLEAMTLAASYKVGLYSKPHLVHFEERCRINGNIVKAAELLPHFEAVEAARGDIALTYFEFTTLVIMRTLASAPLDLVILEVGLGGRLDAVNAIDADVAVITSIDIDHVEYLGPDRESIGREKAHIARPGRPLIVCDPVPPQSIIDYGALVGADVWLNGRDFNYAGDRQQWAWSGRGKRWHSLGYPALRGANQLLNASGALAALETLKDRLPMTAQSVRIGLASVELPGRFQIVPGTPALVLDVAHNPHSVAALALNLDQMGFFKRTFAVFGAMHDKDLAGVVGKLTHLVDDWMLTDLPLPRAAKATELAECVWALTAAAPSSTPKPRVSMFASPQEALAAALAQADPADRIVVFGSFNTVGGVLKDGPPRLVARHLG
jgi:dihydrofolate synthase/folylpolyglutamate synthase